MSPSPARSQQTPPPSRTGSATGALVFEPTNTPQRIYGHNTVIGATLHLSIILTHVYYR